MLHCWSGILGRNIRIMPPPGIEPRVVGRLTRSLVTTPTELSLPALESTVSRFCDVSWFAVRQLVSTSVTRCLREAVNIKCRTNTQNPVAGIGRRTMKQSSCTLLIGGRENVVGVTGWKVRESNPGGGGIFRTRPERTWVPPSLLYNGYRVSFLGVKRPERGVDHPPLPRPRLWKRSATHLPSICARKASKLRNLIAYRSQ